MAKVKESSTPSTEASSPQNNPTLNTRRLLAAVLKHLSDGLLLTDPHGQVMLINPALEQMLGRPAATLLGKALPADLAPGIGPIIGQALEAAPRPAEGEISLSEERQIQVSASAIEGETGVVIGILTTLRDISQRRVAEQVKDAVLSTISHELRTPLASIVGFSTLAANTLQKRLVPHLSLDSGAKRAVERLTGHLERIDESGQMLQRMIDNLLDLADMEAGRAEWNMDDVSLLDVTHAAILIVQSRAEAKGLPIHLSLPPDLPAVRGDRSRLVQVVVNLLSNAIKFTARGHIQISAKTVSSEESAPPLPSGDYILTSVLDTGQGIAPETLPLLFEKFFQPGDVLVDKPPGIGLGLALCREIIEHHGGKIWAESKAGRGSVFHFTLPWDSQARPAQPILGRELRRWLAATAPESPTPPTLLVAHANAQVGQLLQREFASDELTLFLASDCESCRQILESESPALLVLDLFLPDAALLHRPSLPPTLLLGMLESTEGARVATGEMMPSFAGADLILRSLPSHLALNWDKAIPEGRLLILDANAPSLGGIDKTLRAQGFDTILSPPFNEGDPDQVIIESALALLNPTNIQSTTHYRNSQRSHCTVILIKRP